MMIEHESDIDEVDGVESAYYYIEVMNCEDYKKGKDYHAYLIWCEANGHTAASRELFSDILLFD